MASNHTTNYNLNQWEATDQVLRTEFNQDNAKIDAALKGLADKDTALEAMVSAATGAAGNCEMEFFTYYGTGDYGSGNATQITFSTLPDVFFIVGDMAVVMGRGGVKSGVLIGRDVLVDSSFVSDISGTWSGNRVSYVNSLDARYQMNTSGKTYWVLGLKRKQ